MSITWSACQPWPISAKDVDVSCNCISEVSRWTKTRTTSFTFLFGNLVWYKGYRFKNWCIYLRFHFLNSIEKTETKRIKHNHIPGHVRTITSPSSSPHGIWVPSLTFGKHPPSVLNWSGHWQYVKPSLAWQVLQSHNS